METKDKRSAASEQSRRIAPPQPIKLQVCLSAEEQARLSEQARAAGFETVSAFVRARTLGPVGR
jgi:hypothetical protein